MSHKVFSSIHRFFSIITMSLLFIGINAYANSRESTIVLNSGNDSYAVLQIANPYGNAFTISAGEDSGAIGYELNGEVFWLKGQPEISSSSDGFSTYKWSNSGRVVVLKMKDKGNEKVLEFQLESLDEEPSAWFLNIEATSDEYFTGIFERVVDGVQYESWKKGITTSLNLRGEKMDVKLKPTVSAYAPFYISSENYGFFVHGSWPGVIDFCKEKSNLIQLSFEGSELSFTLMMEETPSDLVKKHALETGPSYVPPKWAFGPWRWRDEHFNKNIYFDGSVVTTPYGSDVVEDILMMQAYDIPCTAYWIDRPWGPGSRGFDDYKIDYNRLPHFEEMISWLNSKEIEVMLWIGPFVMGDMADVAENRGYGLESNEWKKSRQVLMDFSNPEACKWWADNGPSKLAKMGVKGYKLDRADGEKLLDSLDLTTFSGKTYRENFNDYSRQYVKATYDAVKPVLGDDFILFPRAQYTGSAKYGAMWAGDTGNSAEGLRSAVIGMQRCSIMGYPIWGSDTGGYPKHIQREVSMRWMGFSCFSPIMEVGPTNNLGFWAMDYDPGFDQELLAVWRFYAKLRMSLVDYIYQYAKEAHDTGMPVARPLFLEYPDQPECWEDWTTYKLGDDLLVSIVWEEGKTSQKVFLPAGDTWINLWTNQEYEGGKYVDVQAPLHQTPVFLRKGSKLRLPDFNQLYQESVTKTSVQYKMSDLQEQEDWKQPTRQK